MSRQVWILGATGRTGRVIARSLNNEKVPLVLAGRDGARLQSVADDLDGGSGLRVGTLEQLLRQLTQSGAVIPEVVINTVGPFAATGRQVARACPPGTHYGLSRPTTVTTPGQKPTPLDSPARDRPLGRRSCHAFLDAHAMKMT